MPAKVLSVPHGPAATALLDAELASAQVLSPLDPVTVVTPTARSAVHLRHEILARRRRASGNGALGNVRFLVLARLAEFAGGAVLRGEGRRRLTRADIGAALRIALTEQPALLGPAAAHRASEIELIERYEELRAAGATALDGLAATGGRGRELARLFTTVRALLERRCYDDVDLCLRGAESIARGQFPLLGTVLVHLPAPLRPAEGVLLSALSDVGDLVVLLGEDGDAPRGAELVKPSPPATAVQLSFGDPDPAPEADLLGGEVATLLVARTGALPSPRSRTIGFDRLLVAPEPASEVREVVRLALERLSGGTPPERIALLYTTATPYAPLLAAELDAVGLASSGRAPQPLHTSPTTRFLLHLLGLSRRGLSRSALISLCNAAPLGAPGGPVPVAEWDRCSRLGGIIEGDAAYWETKLSSLAASSRRSLERHEAGEAPPSSSRPPGRTARTLRATETLMPFVGGLDRCLATLERATSWSAFVAAAAAALEALLGPAAERAGWPGWAGPADALVLATLDELADLDDIEPAPDLERFASAAALALERPGPHVGKLGSGIVVGPLDQAAALDLDLVVVLGAGDGQIPARPPASPLLSNPERLGAGLEAWSAAASFSRDNHRLALAARAGVERIASYAANEAGGRTRSASRLIAEEVPRTPLRHRAASVEAVGEGSAIALDLTELQAGVLFAAARRGEPILRHWAVAADPQLQAGVALGLGRALGRLGPYAGALQVEGLGALLSSTPFSPTSLEQYASCPFKYLLGHVLGLEVIDDPERRLFIDPRDRGSIVHEVLEHYVAEVIAAGPAWEESLGAARLATLAEESFAHYERLGRTGKGVLWELERRRLLRLLETERRADEVRRRGGVVPIAVEHTFGLGAAPAVEVEVAGRPIRFRGMIDRVDALPGAVRVIDYKTGQPGPFRAIREDPVDRGRHLQLAVYGLAARSAFAPEGDEVHAAFRFLGGAGEEISLELNDTSRERFEEVLDVLVSSIDAGQFPYRPGEASFGSFVNCRYCDFDAICPKDRDERWEAVRLSPGLARYRALAEDAPDTAPSAGSPSSIPAGAGQ